MKPMRTRRLFRVFAAGLAGMTFATATPAGAASHREAPITALDHKADITDFFAFVSYDAADKVTLLLAVDPLAEPSNGPNYWPFDDELRYAIRVDNDNDAKEDIVFEVRFRTEVRASGIFTGFVGNANVQGVGFIPPITALDGAGSEGFNLRQKYTVTMRKRNPDQSFTTVFTTSQGSPGGGTTRDLISVPSNVGPKTMPNYPALARQGIYSLGGAASGIRVFAGTAYDPFYIDLGAAFDTLNFRASAGGGVLSPAQDANDSANFAPDDVAGFNVNLIALEVPARLLTRTGTSVLPTDPAATIGVWGTTARPRVKVQPSQPGGRSIVSANAVQIQRMGNPLFNELIIPTELKNKWSMSPPKNDAQFASFALDPLLARVLAGLGLPFPTPPRNDLLFLVQYDAHADLVASVVGFPAPDVSAGPVADLLRLNIGIAPTPQASRKRLGLLAGDPAGFPNGRRVSDDVTDVAARAVAGILRGAPFTAAVGDGVNTKNVPYQETFPYVAFAVSGKNSRHVDPGEAGCGPIPPGAGTCPKTSPLESPNNP
jgi:hypothetical protein